MAIKLDPNYIVKGKTQDTSSTPIKLDPSLIVSSENGHYKAAVKEAKAQNNPLLQTPALKVWKGDISLQQGIKEAKKQEELRTTIPSRTYDASFVEEVRLRDEMKKAEQNLKDVKANDNRNFLEKVLQYGSSIDPIFNAKKDYNKAKKEYEDYKAIKFYASLPDGEAKTTNPNNKKDYYQQDKSVDWLHEYINNFNNYREKHVTTNPHEGYYKYALMDDREIGIYNYLYNTDVDKAKEFLKFIDDDLNQRQQQKNLDKFTGKNAATAVAGSVASVPVNLIAAGEQTVNSINYLLTGEIKENYSSKFANTMRSAVTDKYDWEIGNWDAFDFIYNTTMSGADSIAAASMGNWGAVALGLSAAANTTNDIISRGGTAEQAFWGGVASGVFEGFFEKFSIGQLSTMKDSVGSGFKVYASNMAKSMLVNSSEETATEVANILYDYAANGGISQYAELIKEYMQKNPKASEKSARDYAAKQLGIQIIQAGLSGALMGFGFGALGSAFSHKNASSIGKIIAANGMESQVLDLALKTDENSTAYKLAAKISNSGEMSTAKIGNLAVETITEFSNKKNNIVSNAVYNRMLELGINESNALNTSKLFASVLSDDNIKNTIRNNLNAEPVIKQITVEMQNPESNLWVAEMTAELGVVENAISQITEATKFSQNPSLQNGGDDGIISNNEQVGDEANGGNSEVYNDSERSRGESSDTESGIGTLQGHDGGSNREVQSDGNFGRSSQMFPNQRNNRRIEPTAEQKENLKTTAIKDENGNPKVVSHFTDNMDFETFEKGDIGFHFGNEQQAVERGKNLKKAGRIIKAHLDIKNPLNIPTDLMNWTPFNIAFKLSVEGIISAEDFAKIITLTNEGGSDYNSPAAVELRRILGDLGYDGIVYENMFEADGESYIAFYPEQVIIIDDGNTQADPNGPANFMPEGENEGEVGLSEPEVKEIYRDPTSQEENEAIFGKRKDAKQRHVIDVAKKLDSNMTVVFVDPDSDKLSGQKGAYMHDTNTVYISTDNSVVGMYCQIFKHEFVHRLESKQAYQGFKNYLFNHSSAFERYIQAELKRINGTDFDGTREEAIKALSDHYIDLVKKSGFTEEYKRDFSSEYAEREMVANFVGKVLFKGKENIADVAQNLSDGEIDKILSLEDTFAEFESLNETERGWFQRIIDTIKDFVATLKGIKQNERLVNDLEYVEQRLARVLDSKDTKKAASRAVDRQYSLDSYSEHQINNWKNSKNIVIYQNEKQLRDFIRDANNGINLDKKMYFGAISQELADRIKQDTGIDVNKYNCTLRASEIRKIINDHGNEETELLRGQRAITEDDFVLIPEIIQSPDKIVLSDELFEGKPVIHFVKTINGKTTIAAYVSAKHLDLTVQTMYSGKNKGNLAIAAGEQAPANTPEANAGTVSNNRVPHEADSVNSNSMQETQDYSQNDGEIKQSFALDNLTTEETDSSEAEKSTPSDKPTERFIKTIIETGTLTDEMLEGMHEKLLLGDFSYEVMSDKVALEKAEKTIEYGTAENIWQEVINNNSRISKNQIAIGEKLLAKAIKEKDTKKVLALSSELADVFTRAGQVVQAARLLNKMTGAGRLISAQRTVETLNRDLRAKYGEDFRPIKISDAAAKRLAEAKTKEGIEHAYEEVMYEVAEQTPVTFLDKWNAWRYFAMLSNPKTHIRNIVGNAIFVPAVRIRYFLAASIESAKIKDSSQRTKSVIIKKEYRDFAERDSKRNEVKQLLKGNKYNDKSAIREKQQTFKSAALNFLTEFNSNALETEDILFKNKHYIHALAGYLQARGLDLKSVPAEVLDDARIYAVEEAKKATFNDESALANAIQRFANKNLATNLLVEGVLPFKRTPINIVKRGVEYSPLGLAKTLTKGINDVKKGKITPTEYIDGLASGLTGTGIMLVGMFLANLGCVAGGEKEDDESQFEKLLGKQEYAIEFLGKSYTIDWAAPSCIPFFIGVEIVNTLNEGEAFTWSQLGNTVWNSLEPITNLSMISGIQGVIESAKYADSSQTLSAIITDALTSYSMQGIPSLAGAFSRTIDPTQRTWYTDKNSKWFDASSQAFINNVKSKIPGLSYTQIPKIDMWGRVVSRGGTAERVLENFVSPGYYSEMEYNDTNEELKRIFNKTDVDVFPNTAAKSFEVNGKTKHLTADEYVTYAKAKGEYSFDYINEFMEDSAYKNLSDQERADVIQGLYEYSNAKAKATVSDYDITKRYKTVTNWEQNGRSAVDYYIYKAITK